MTVENYNSAKANREEKALVDAAQAALPSSFGIESEVEVTATDVKNYLDVYLATFCPNSEWIHERYHTAHRTAIEAFFSVYASSLSDVSASLDTTLTEISC